MRIGLSREEAATRHHLPEPWSGNLTGARILFVLSNPSFGIDDHFPDSSWSDDDVTEYFTRRFVRRGERHFGATDGPTIGDQDRSITRTRDGQVGFSPRVRTWQVLRRRAADILGRSLRDTLAAEHYAMTEVVRCKSQKEIGVAKALTACVDMWLMETLVLSPARLLVVSGAPAGAAVQRTVEHVSGGRRLPDTWGSWNSNAGTPGGQGKWPGSWRELSEWKSAGQWTMADQAAHTAEMELDVMGERRRYMFVWLPHPVRSVPQQLSDASLIDPELLQRWRTVATSG